MKTKKAMSSKPNYQEIAKLAQEFIDKGDRKSMQIGASLLAIAGALAAPNSEEAVQIISVFFNRFAQEQVFKLTSIKNRNQ